MLIKKLVGKNQSIYRKYEGFGLVFELVRKI